MIRPILLLVVFSLAMSAEADDGFGLRSRHFEYPPSVTESMGPAMPREVTIAPAFDRSRAYLLDITEEEIVGRPQAPPCEISIALARRVAGYRTVVALEHGR